MLPTTLTQQQQQHQQYHYHQHQQQQQQFSQAQQSLGSGSFDLSQALNAMAISAQQSSVQHQQQAQLDQQQQQQQQQQQMSFSNMFPFSSLQPFQQSQPAAGSLFPLASSHIPSVNPTHGTSVLHPSLHPTPAAASSGVLSSANILAQHQLQQQVQSLYTQTAMQPFPTQGQIVPATIHLSNLHYGVSWRQVADVCSEFGHVEHVEMLTTPTGVPTGHATVRFQNSQQAAAALYRLGDRELHGRRIRVREEVIR